MMLLIIFFTCTAGSILRGNLDEIDGKICVPNLPIAATVFPKGELKCLSPKEIFQNAKLKNVNRNTLIYFPHRHFERYIFSNLKWEKNDFYFHKIGDYLRVIPHKGCLTMVKNKHSAYILRTFGIDPFYRQISTTFSPTTRGKWTTQKKEKTTTTSKPPTTSSTSSSSTTRFSTQKIIEKTTSTPSSTPRKTTKKTPPRSSTPSTPRSYTPRSSTPIIEKTTPTPSSTPRKTTKKTPPRSSTPSTPRSYTPRPSTPITTATPSSTPRKTTKKTLPRSSTPSTPRSSSFPVSTFTPKASTRAGSVTPQKSPAPPKTILLAITIPTIICLIILIITAVVIYKKRQNGMNLVGYIYENEEVENTIGETEL